MGETVWLFAYGSILYKTDFPYLERQPAQIRGWQRRFYQGSHDHRGTPAQPGRVVTLLPQAEAICAGEAFLITPEEFAHLDEREKNGYARLMVDVELGEQVVQGVVYVADQDNPAYLGHADLDEIARHICRCHGPSGSNLSYLLNLATALRQLGINDTHIFDLEAATQVHVQAKRRSQNSL